MVFVFYVNWQAGKRGWSAWCSPRPSFVDLKSALCGAELQATEQAWLVPGTFDPAAD